MSAPTSSSPVPDELDELFGFSAARKRAEEAAIVPEDLNFIKHRVFMNNVDTFNTKYIAAFITDQIYGALKIAGGGMDEGAEQALEEEVAQKPPGKITGDKYEFIGTLGQPFHKKTEDILFTIDETREDFMQEIIKCGVVIYDISQDPTEMPKALRALKAIVEELEGIKDTGPKTYRNYSDERIFILISTVMTWAMTKPLDPDDPEVAFSEIDYKKRKPHPNYKEHIACEREVVLKSRKLRDKLKTYVVCCGIIYGMEEEDLDFLFRMAWYHEKYLPVFQEGKNFVPLIHIKDLAKVIHALMEIGPPKPQYILAVEQTPTKQKDIVKALSKAMGSGRIKEITAEGAFLIKEINQTVFERLTVNLNMEPVFIVENLQVEFQNDLNLAENMPHIVAEYREARKLKPIRVVLHGPPASGKTTLAKSICKHYGTHYVNIKKMIEETIEELTENIETERTRQRVKAEQDRLKAEAKAAEEEDEEEEEEEDEEEEVEGDIEEWEEQLRDIQTIMAETEDGKLPDDYVVRLMRNFLGKNVCQNQGYVLDGYPKTLQQAKELFGFAAEGADEELGEGEEGAAGVGAGATKLLPDFVISLEASDEFLCQRIMNLPEELVQETHYTEEGMIRRLTEFRINNTEDSTVLNFFDENEIHPIVIEVVNFDGLENVLEELISNCMGPPVGFALSPEEEKQLIKLQEEQEQLEQERKQLENELNEKQAAKEYHEKMERWTATLEQLQMEEEKILVARSKSLRNYLMQHVFPTLTKALIEVARVKPNDPVDFLAEYLFRENPEGSMFDPTYTRDGEALLKQFENEIQEIIEQLEQEKLTLC